MVAARARLVVGTALGVLLLVAAACATPSPPSTPGAQGTAGSTDDPVASGAALPPPTPGEVTLYATFFVGENLDVFEGIELESSSYVVVAMRPSGGAPVVIDRFTDPSYADIWYGRHTSDGRLFATTFAGDATNELHSLAEEDPVTFDPLGRSWSGSNFGSDGFAVVGESLYGVALIDDQPTIARETATGREPIIALDRWPVVLSANRGRLQAAFSTGDVGHYVSFADIDPDAGTLDERSDEWEVTNEGEFESWKVVFDDRDGVPYLARASRDDGLVQVFRLTPGAEEADLVGEAPVGGIDGITGLDADRGRLVVQWRADDGGTSYLLVDAERRTVEEVAVPLDTPAQGLQVIAH